MKKAFLLIFISGWLTRAGAQTLSFQYDAAGNQISREWICVSCITYPVSSVMADVPKPVPPATATAKNEIVPLTTRKLTAYPNPFTETLTLHWENNSGVMITSVEVFTVGGVRVFSQKYEEGGTDIPVGFDHLPAGYYLVRVMYSDKKQEVVKAVKQ